MLVKDLADELGPRGMRVNGILPGRIATDNTFAQDARQGNPHTVRKRREATIPLRRYGDPEEFGRLAAFLLSPAASYITGTLLAIDGGALRAL
jgi:3-oxoacyl-[acyl-carrier protein] reductase